MRERRAWGQRQGWPEGRGLPGSASPAEGPWEVGGRRKGPALGRDGRRVCRGAVCAPSCPHQELLLRGEPSEVCAWGWQSLGPVASKDGWPASAFPNLPASRSCYQGALVCNEHPLAEPMEPGSLCPAKTQNPPQVRVREPGVPGARGRAPCSDPGATGHRRARDERRSQGCRLTQATLTLENPAVPY